VINIFSYVNRPSSSLVYYFYCLVYDEASVFSGFVTFHSNSMVLVEVVEIGLGGA